MTLDEIIDKLSAIRDCVGGGEEVIVDSNIWVVSHHQIKDVQDDSVDGCIRILT